MLMLLPSYSSTQICAISGEFFTEWKGATKNPQPTRAADVIYASLKTRPQNTHPLETMSEVYGGKRTTV